MKKGKKDMYKNLLENKNKNRFLYFLKRVKNIFREPFCKLYIFNNKLFGNMCFKDDELEKIKQKVDEVHSDAKQFKTVQNLAPILNEKINEIKEENNSLEMQLYNCKERNLFLIKHIEELFEFECKNDKDSRKKIYKKLGFLIEQIR